MRHSPLHSKLTLPVLPFLLGMSAVAPTETARGAEPQVIDTIPLDSPRQIAISPDGKTALTVAVSQGHKDVENVLRNAVVKE